MVFPLLIHSASLGNVPKDSMVKYFMTFGNTYYFCFRKVSWLMQNPSCRVRELALESFQNKGFQKGTLINNVANVLEFKGNITGLPWWRSG